LRDGGSSYYGARTTSLDPFTEAASQPQVQPPPPATGKLGAHSPLSSPQPNHTWNPSWAYKLQNPHPKRARLQIMVRERLEGELYG
jgi:hypothetical protein